MRFAQQKSEGRGKETLQSATNVDLVASHKQRKTGSERNAELARREAKNPRKIICCEGPPLRANA